VTDPRDVPNMTTKRAAPATKLADRGASGSCMVAPTDTRVTPDKPKIAAKTAAIISCEYMGWTGFDMNSLWGIVLFKEGLCCKI